MSANVPILVHTCSITVREDTNWERGEEGETYLLLWKVRGRHRLSIGIETVCLYSVHPESLWMRAQYELWVCGIRLHITRTVNPYMRIQVCFLGGDVKCGLAHAFVRVHACVTCASICAYSAYSVASIQATLSLFLRWQRRLGSRLRLCWCTCDVLCACACGWAHVESTRVKKESCASN